MACLIYICLAPFLVWPILQGDGCFSFSTLDLPAINLTEIFLLLSLSIGMASQAFWFNAYLVLKIS